MDALDIIKMRSEKADLECVSTTSKLYSYDEHTRAQTIREVPAVQISFPNGRRTRIVTVSEPKAERFNAINFEDWVFLGDYAAIFDRKSKTIEAITRGGHPGQFVRALFKTLAGPDKGTQDGALSEPELGGELGEQDADADAFTFDSPSPNPKVIARFAPISITLSLMEILPSLGRGYALALQLRESLDYSQALDLLEKLSKSLFFEIDLIYGLQLSLQVSLKLRAAPIRGPRSQPPAQRAAQLPRVQYSDEAASLYAYGRSATGMPLLEFLAYYQVMEYFFPVYSKQEMTQRLRQQLVDPRFDANSDSDLARVVNLLAGGSRVALAESEQLKATLRRCVDDATLKDFIGSDASLQDFVTGKQELKGVRTINFANRDQSIADQVAVRVYDIRCRIVHSKEDGGGGGAQMLLPFGEEARKLHFDIALARYLAQKVLIAGAKVATWA